MAPGFRLLPLLELARRRLEAASIALQQLGNRRREAEAKLAQLQGFQREYAATLEQGLARGMELDRLRDFQAFLMKIDRAIGLQREEVEQCQLGWQAAHHRWLALRRDEQALSVLEQRHHTAEAKREERLDQKRQDEFTARKYWQDESDDASGH